MVNEDKSKWAKEAYKQYVDLKITGYKIYGRPGRALRDAQHESEKELSWIQGRLGERLFMSILVYEGILDKCVSFWSLECGDKWDIDCALLFEDELVLVDVKSWSGKHVEEESLSLAQCEKTMEQAVERVRKNLKDCKGPIAIRPYIVFVPTPEYRMKNGVELAGAVTALRYKEFCKQLNSRHKTNRAPQASKQAEKRLRGMVIGKDKSARGRATGKRWDNEKWKQSYDNLLGQWKKQLKSQKG